MCFFYHQPTCMFDIKGLGKKNMFKKNVYMLCYNTKLPNTSVIWFLTFYITRYVPKVSRPPIYMSYYELRSRSKLTLQFIYHIERYVKEVSRFKFKTSCFGHFLIVFFPVYFFLLLIVQYHTICYIVKLCKNTIIHGSINCLKKMCCIKKRSYLFNSLIWFLILTLNI